MKNPFTRLAAVLLAIVAGVHLLRVIFDIPVRIDGFALPIWVSVLAFMIPGTLSIMLWREARRDGNEVRKKGLTRISK